MTVKTLTTLIKIHKQKADVSRREMIALEEEQHQLQKLSEKTKLEHEQEAKLVLTEPEYAGFFGSYSNHTQKKLAALREEIKRLDKAIEDKRQQISEEYSEQKKYEIAQENIKKRMLEEDKHRLQKRFDEVATQQYARNQENPL